MRTKESFFTENDREAIHIHHIRHGSDVYGHYGIIIVVDDHFVPVVQSIIAASGLDFVFTYERFVVASHSKSEIHKVMLQIKAWRKAETAITGMQERDIWIRFKLKESAWLFTQPSQSKSNCPPICMQG